MPFEKITSGKNKGKYRSPTGRIYNQAQVNLYHAGDGFPRTRKAKSKTKKKRRRA